MRLTKDEKKLIKEWWNSDLEIEIKRKRYVVILVSNAYYIHYRGLQANRKVGEKRGLDIYFPKSDERITEIGYNELEAFQNPNEAIEYLKEYGNSRTK
jgi:hypothetical protein